MQDLKHEEERSWWDMSDWSQEQVGRGVEMSGFATIAEVKEAEEEEHSSLAWQSALSGCRVG